MGHSGMWVHFAKPNPTPFTNLLTNAIQSTMSVCVLTQINPSCPPAAKTLKYFHYFVLMHA